MKLSTLAIAALTLLVGANGFAQGKVRDREAGKKAAATVEREVRDSRAGAVEARAKNAAPVAGGAGGITRGLQRAMVTVATAVAIATPFDRALVREDLVSTTQAVVQVVREKYIQGGAFQEFVNPAHVEKCSHPIGEHKEALSTEAYGNLVVILDKVRGSTNEELANSAVEVTSGLFEANEELKEELRAKGFTEREMKTVEACRRVVGISSAPTAPNGCPILNIRGGVAGCMQTLRSIFASSLSWLFSECNERRLETGAFGVWGGPVRFFNNCPRGGQCSHSKNQ